jgi:hypothetical protein
MVGTFSEGGTWHGFVADLTGNHLLVIDAQIGDRVARDTGVVAVQGACLLGYFDRNQNGQSGFVRCKGKKDILIRFSPNTLTNPRGILEDGTIFGDFDSGGGLEGFLLPSFVKP